MKYLKLISINSYKLFSIATLFVIILISGCTKNEYPNPTEEFYVNDYANAFHPTTQNVIIVEGERLYEDTKDIENIGGVQIVFATFIVENINEIANYNRTDIFRQWEIGKNDMGILVLMFFTEGTEEETNYIYLEETQIEVGYRMEEYLTAAEQGRLLDSTIYSNTYDDLDMKVAYLYYEILKLVYVEVYNEYYVSFTYDMEEFRETMDSYVPTDDTIDLGLIALLLVFLSGSSGKWYLIIPGVLLLLGGGIRLSRNRGGGGSSGGYGIFRRR